MRTGVEDLHLTGGSLRILSVISGRGLQQKTLVSVNHLFPSNSVYITNAVHVGLSFSRNVFLDKFEVNVQPAVLYIKNVILLFQEQLKLL